MTAILEWQPLLSYLLLLLLLFYWLPFWTKMFLFSLCFPFSSCWPLSLSFWPTFCFNAGEEEEWGQRRSCHIMAIRSLSQGKASALSFSPAATASGRRPFLFPTDRFVSETWGSIHTWRRVQRAINGHPTYWRLNPWVGKGEKKEKKAREALHNNGKRPAA